MNYDLFNVKEDTTINQIDYVRDLYENQKIKVKNEQYIENLLLQDYIRAIRKNVSKYDLINDMLCNAPKELGEKLKKNRKNLEAVKSFIRLDFLNDDKNFKLTNIISYGYPTYALAFEFDGYKKTFRIEIPMKKALTIENIQIARFGKFAFTVKTSSSCWSLIKSSYKISDIADAVKDYFAMTEIVNSLETDR